jgi:hypothetical protein
MSGGAYVLRLSLSQRPSSYLHQAAAAKTRGDSVVGIVKVSLAFIVSSEINVEWFHDKLPKPTNQTRRILAPPY